MLLKISHNYVFNFVFLYDTFYVNLGKNKHSYSVLLVKFENIIILFLKSLMLTKAYYY